MLYDSWDNRAFHLIVADPGEGLTMSIRDLQKRAGGRSVLAVVAPKNMEDEQALGDQFFSAFYPLIHFPHDSWIKLAAIYWDALYWLIIRSMTLIQYKSYKEN